MADKKLNLNSLLNKQNSSEETKVNDQKTEEPVTKENEIMENES
jgi:hypothetical protein